MGPYEGFAAGIAEVQLLSGQDPLRERLDGDKALSSALERGACVLVVSHFEGFLKELAEDFVERLITSSIEMKRVPVKLREVHTLPRLDEIVRTSDDSQRGVLLSRLAAIAYLWNPDAKVEAGRLVPSVVSRVVTSAQPESVDALFALFGADQVCDGHIEVEEADGTAAPVKIRTKLREIVDCRNDIAHGDAERKVTHEDLDRYVAFLERLARRLCALADQRLSDLTA